MGSVPSRAPDPISFGDRDDRGQYVVTENLEKRYSEWFTCKSFSANGYEKKLG